MIGINFFTTLEGLNYYNGQASALIDLLCVKRKHSPAGIEHPFSRASSQ
jgi:hypothetical protein